MPLGTMGRWIGVGTVIVAGSASFGRAAIQEGGELIGRYPEDGRDYLQNVGYYGVQSLADIWEGIAAGVSNKADDYINGSLTPDTPVFLAKNDDGSFRLAEGSDTETVVITAGELHAIHQGVQSSASSDLNNNGLA